jgi:hypothetical protein
MKNNKLARAIMLFNIGLIAAEIVLKIHQAWREVSVAAQIVAGIKTMGVN